MRLAMQLRYLAGVSVMVGALAAGIVTAGAFATDERFPWTLGRGGGGGMFSSSPVQRATVSYPSNLAPGSMVISTAERRLYFILGNGQAIRYGIGVGRPGFTWSGLKHVSAKK